MLLKWSAVLCAVAVGLSLSAGAGQGCDPNQQSLLNSQALANPLLHRQLLNSAQAVLPNTNIDYNGYANIAMQHYMIQNAMVQQAMMQQQMSSAQRPVYNGKYSTKRNRQLQIARILKQREEKAFAATRYTSAE